MGEPAARHPRVPPSTRRVVEVLLTVIWLGGTAYLLGPAHAPWWTVVVLLAAVGVAELLFRRWNDGHWPGAEGEPGAG